MRSGVNFTISSTHMKILSNFDTKFREKVLQKRKESCDERDILVIQRSRYYFMFRVFLPFCIFL